MIFAAEKNLPLRRLPYVDATPSDFQILRAAREPSLAAAARRLFGCRQPRRRFIFPMSFRRFSSAIGHIFFFFFHIAEIAFQNRLHALLFFPCRYFRLSIYRLFMFLFDRVFQSHAFCFMLSRQSEGACMSGLQAAQMRRRACGEAEVLFEREMPFAIAMLRRLLQAHY